MGFNKRSVESKPLDPISVGRYPLVAFFVMAYAGTWLLYLPLLLGQNGLGVFPIKLPLIPTLALATLTGPAFSALMMAVATGGKAAARALLLRYTIWRFNPIWYAVIAFVPPVALLIGSVISLGISPLQTLVEQAMPFIVNYPLFMIIGLVTGPLGEELGWRGFALPRLQERVGPLVACLILGLLWAAWHLPLFFMPEWAGTNDPAVLMLAYFSWVVPFTVIMSWVSNHTRGSLLAATLLHTASNAATGLVVAGILVVPPNDAFLLLKVYGLLAVLLIILTRGRLGYKGESEALSSASVTGAAEMTAPSSPLVPASTVKPMTVPDTRVSLLRKIVIGLVVSLVLVWGVANLVYVLLTSSN
jgi:uncharacterized protein